MIQEKIYRMPSSVSEAINFAKSNSDSYRYLAGGTDIMPNKFQGNDQISCLIDLSKIENLRGVSAENNMLRIGALETLSSLAKNPLVIENFPVLIEAILSVGSPLIRYSATLGGNVLCENRCLYYNQSEWWRQSVGYCLKCDGDICIATQGKNACFSEMVSDTAPALIALNAKIEYEDLSGKHIVPLESIYTGDGVKPKNLPTEAIVHAILIPSDKKYRCHFKKLRERESLEFTSLTCCITADEKNNIRIVLSGVDPKPVLIEGLITDDPETLITRAVKAARTVDNDMYTRKYRREMIKVYINEGITKINR
ncbi:MAG: FAD binding domain-containing protein [Crocinitomicaceae bacterium]|nr:FAD binding domain-containing protein [Crocinitomicaceae bacterium]